MFLSKFLTHFCLFSVNFGGKILDYFDILTAELNKYAIINYLMSTISIYYNLYYVYVNDLLIEPEGDFLRSAIINEENELECYYHNIEELENTNNKVNKLINKKYNSLITHNFSNNDQEYVSSIITNGKLNPLFVDIHSPDCFDLKQYIINFNKYYKSSNIRGVENNDIKPFLAIQYSNPKQSDKLSINLEKKYYTIHNDVLDSVFIKTYLSKTYNKNNYVFDNNYEIIIIDNNAIFHTLKYNQYIHFEQKKWSVLEK